MREQGSRVRAATGAAWVIGRAELRGAVSGRLVQGLGLLFGLLAVGITVAGLAASGLLLVQGFTRTAVSLLTLALYLLPLLGLVLGAHAFGGEDGGTELLLAQPVGRATVLLGRGLGLAATLLLVSATGFGLAGIVVVWGAGTAGLGHYLLVAAGSSMVGIAGLAIGMLLGVRTRRRVTAVATALVVWVALAVLFDFAAIALLHFVGDGDPGPLLLGLLAANPLDGMRALALVALGADVLLGPTGAAMAKLLGPSGGALIVGAALVAWCVGPLVWATRTYRRKDF